MSKGYTFVVVENAGYEGECQWPKLFKSSSAAWQYAEKKYEADELEDLHVAVALLLDNGDLTYDY